MLQHRLNFNVLLCPDEQWGLHQSKPATTTNYYELISFVSALWWVLLIFIWQKTNCTSHPSYCPDNICLCSWWISILRNNCLGSKDKSDSEQRTYISHFHSNSSFSVIHWKTDAAYTTGCGRKTDAANTTGCGRKTWPFLSSNKMKNILPFYVYLLL